MTKNESLHTDIHTLAEKAALLEQVEDSTTQEISAPQSHLSRHCQHAFKVAVLKIWM